MKQPRILLYRTGETAAEVVRDVGNYREWFSRVVGDRASLEPHMAWEMPHADHREHDAIIITGSPLSLVSPAPWMEDACAFVRGAAAAGKAILGVCFGHQLVGRAFGGSVRKNPRGWEAGTHEVHLTDEGKRDPLFAGMPDSLRVNQSHMDEVDALGPATVRLAGGGHSENQAIAVGDHVRGVQFHPEMNGTVIRRVIENRKRILTDDAHATGRATTHDAVTLLSRAADTPDAERVVLNFVERFAARA